MIQVIQGKTVQDAIKEATKKYGDDCEIIETRKKKGGLLKPDSYEVVIKVPDQNQDAWSDASRGLSRFEKNFGTAKNTNIDLSLGNSINEYEDVLDFKFGKEKTNLITDKQEAQQRVTQSSNPYKNQAYSHESDNDTKINLAERARKILKLAEEKKQTTKINNFSSPNSNSLLEQVSPHQSSKKSLDLKLKEDFYKDIKSEIKAEIKAEFNKFSDDLNIIKNMFWEEKKPHSTAIPPEFSEIYKIAKQSGMNQEHLDMIMKLSIEHMPSKMRQNSETVKRYFKALLRKMIPVKAETLVKRPDKKIYMLVGSTGVGKTTTIAKLAARYSMTAGMDYKVGLIVMDTYKIGAIEQLAQYAKMMRIPMEMVVTPVDLEKKIEDMRDRDYIFIDTMGSSPYDLEKIENIKDFLEAGKYTHQIEVMLVLSSSLKYEDLIESYKSFSQLNIDTILFTKLDETKGFGNIFSLIHDIKKPISYFSIGQEVPDDIVVASNDYLVDCLLYGFQRMKKQEAK